MPLLPFFPPPSLPSSFASGILNSSSLPPLVSLLSSSVFSSIPFFRRKSFSRNFSSLLQCGEKGGEERKGEGFAKTFRGQRPFESFRQTLGKTTETEEGGSSTTYKGKAFPKASGLKTAFSAPFA